MYRITDTQIDFILSDLSSKGILTEDLQQNLLDHICILIEQGLEEGGDFEAFYDFLMPSLYRQKLDELEAETRFLLAHRKSIALLTRGQLFSLLFVVLIGPVIAYAGCWLTSEGSKEDHAIVTALEGV